MIHSPIVLSPRRKSTYHKCTHQADPHFLPDVQCRPDRALIVKFALFVILNVPLQGSECSSSWFMAASVCLKMFVVIRVDVDLVA